MYEILMWIGISITTLLIWLNNHANSGDFLHTPISKLIFICFVLIPLAIIHPLVSLTVLFVIFYMKYHLHNVDSFQGQSQSQSRSQKTLQIQNQVDKESLMQRGKQSKHIQVTRTPNSD